MAYTDDDMEYTDKDIEDMRHQLILDGANGSFANINPVSYWSPEEVIEAYEVRFPED